MEKDILEKIYEQYAKQVYLYLYSLCHNQALSEDLMQETFLKAFCSLEHVKSEILPWLFTVARNLYLDTWRKERRRNERNKKIQQEHERQEDSDILGKLIDQEQNQILYEMIQRLDNIEKEAVVLYYFSGLSQEEISRVLRKSYSNIRVILYRARKRLKGMLGASGEHGQEQRQERGCEHEV